MDYKLTEEYRDRFAFNGSERYWMEQAFELYVRTAKRELEADSIITPEYVELLFKDINSKLDQWTE